MPNRVLLFTDAVNDDDPLGVTLEELSSQVKAASDPNRPVSLAIAAFGSQPINGALKAALAPVKGSAVPVTSTAMVEAVFVHAAVGGLR